MLSDLNKRYVIKLLSNIMNSTIGLAILSIVPRELGPAAYGNFVFLKTIFDQLMILLDSSSSTAFFVKLSSNNARSTLIPFYFLISAILLVGMVLITFIATSNGFTEVIFPNIPSGYIYYALFFSYLLWLFNVFIKISDAYALTSSVEIIKVVYKLIYVITLVVIVNITSTIDLYFYYYFNYIALIIFFTVTAYLFKIKGVFITWKIINFKAIVAEFFQYCHPLVIQGLFSVLITILGMWLLNYQSGAEEVAYYGLAFQISAIGILFTAALIPVIMREFSKANSDRENKYLRLLFKKYMDPLFTVAAIMAAFIVVNSEDLVLLFAGPEYVDAAAALSVIGLYTLHQTYGQMTGGFLLAVNKSKLYANIGLIMLLLDVILVLLFVYYLNFGSYGMALKMLIVNIVGSNVMLYYVAKIINTNIKPMLLNQLTITVVFLLIAFLEKSIVSFSDNIIIDTIVSGSIYLIMSILFIFIFPRIVGISYARRRGILSLLRLNR